jgi:1-acyl-sn-glycerol-3-phosphate acyltransferase
VIRTVVMLAFWGIALPIAALIFIPWTLITGDIRALYRTCMWGAFAGIRLAGIRVETIGKEKLDPARTYIYMSNHASNIDPPLLLPLIPQRTSVMAKKELFRYPLLGTVMRIGALVPVDRGDREAGIAAVKAATEVVRQGISMTIYVEGKRSLDGKLLPFKKGPFYLAMQSGVPVVPVTIAGTYTVMPKRRFAITPGWVRVVFHDPIEPGNFESREDLMDKVRRAMDSGLPRELQQIAQAKGEAERSEATG